MKQSRVVILVSFLEVQGNSKWRNIFTSFCLEMQLSQKKNQVSAIYREPCSYFNVGVKPEKPDVPTSQCHPVLELIALEISLTIGD